MAQSRSVVIKSALSLGFLFFAVISDEAFAQAARAPLVGYTDRAGQIIEPATYDSGSFSFDGDWVAVRKDRKAGYLNLRTHATTGLIFDQAAEDSYSRRGFFENGPEPVMIDGKWGYTDQHGNLVIPARFDGAERFTSDGLAIVEIATPGSSLRRQGFIDLKGNIVVPVRYQGLRPYSGDLAVFRLVDGYGAIDRDGREVITPHFLSLGNFGGGIAPASINGRPGLETSRYGYVDRKGDYVIPARFRRADGFGSQALDAGFTAPAGLALVVLENDQCAYIDRTGAVVARFPMGFTVFEISANGLVLVQDRATARYGFADKGGKIVIAAEFEQAGAFDDHGLASAQQNGKAGYIRADGSWAITPRFRSAGSFDPFGQAQVEESGLPSLIDRSGKTVAKLAKGTSFYWQRQSEYSAFRFFPPKIDYPPEIFGAWRVERTVYAVPEVPSFMPTPTGIMKLTFTTDDGLVNWSVESEGWVLDIVMRHGPLHDTDLLSRSRLTNLPDRANSLIEIMSRQLDGNADLQISSLPPEAGQRAAQRERSTRIASRRSDYKAQLAQSASDLERAIAAFDMAFKTQFGQLSGMPCMPPQCVY